MTLEELSRLYRLKCAVREGQARLAQLRSGYAPRAAALDGMPHGSIPGRRTESLAVSAADLAAVIKRNTEESEREAERLERYIQSIPDANIRRVFRLRFEAGLTWYQVAAEEGHYSADACKKTVYRYLKKRNEEELSETGRNGP